MNLKKTGAAFGAVAILGTGIVAGIAAPASAHTAETGATCTAISVSLTNYSLKPEVSHVVHHDAVTKTVVDKEAYDEKVVDVEYQPGKDAVPAVTKVVHHDAVTHEEQKLVKEAYDETVIDSPAVPGTPEIPAVYGEKPIITPAVPAQDAVPAVTHIEYKFVQHITGKVRWEKDPNWNAGPKGKGWSKTGECRVVVDTPEKPAVPGKDAVYGEAPLIAPAIPAVPEQPEVSHVVHHEAVYETVTITDAEAYDETVEVTPAQPAVPEVSEVSHTVHHEAVTHEEIVTPASDETVIDQEGDDTPNTVSINVGGQVESEEFGTTFTETIKLDGKTATPYTVDVVAWDDPTGANGWTTQFTGVTEACAVVPPVEPPVTPPVVTPPVVTPPVVTPPSGGGTTPPVVTVPVVNEPVAVVKPIAKPTATPVAKPVDTGDQLAFTGFDEGTKWAGIGALAALLVGGGALTVARRAKHRGE